MIDTFESLMVAVFAAMFGFSICCLIGFPDKAIYSAGIFASVAFLFKIGFLQ